MWNGNAQIRGNVSQIHPLADIGKLADEGFITFFCRKSQPLFVTAVQPAVFVLVDDASPVTQLDVGFEQADQIGQQDAVSLRIFQCFDELFAYLIIIEFVHAEYDSPFAGKGSGNLLSVHQPVRACDSLLDEIRILAEDVFPNQQMPLGKMAGRDAGFQFLDRFVGQRIE